MKTPGCAPSTPAWEGPVSAGHVALGIQYRGVLTEVPDVAAAVLGVVVARPLLELPVQEQLVLHDPRPDPVDDPGGRRRAEQIHRLLPVLGSPIDQRPTGRKG